MMSTIQINLADELRSQLEIKAQESGFADAAGYVRAMVVADLAGPAVNDNQLEKLLLDRADGPFVEMDKNDLDRIRQKFVDRTEEK